MLIVGRGPVAAALALARETPSVLFAPPAVSGGRYYAVNDASAAFLTKAAGEPPPECARVRRFLLCAGGKTRYLDAPENETLCRIVGEDALLQRLYDALQRRGTEMHSAAPVAVRAAADGVYARLADGREFRAPLLVAADGAHSPTARMLNVGAAVSSFGQRALTARFAAPELADDTAAQWFAHRDVLALLPVGGGEFALVWSLPESAARALESGGISAVAAAVRARTGFAVSAADDSAPRGFALYSVRRAARVATKTAFVGDAARVIHPLAGQGLNVGLSDCALLLRCLRRFGDTDAAFAEYAASGGRRGAMLHDFTSFLNCFGGAAFPFFALAARPPFNRRAIRAANG